MSSNILPHRHLKTAWLSTVFCLLALFAPQGFAHQIGAMQNRLDIIQQEVLSNEGTYPYKIRWRSSDANLAFVLPDGCNIKHGLPENFNLWQCNKSLEGKTIHVSGLMLSDAEVLTRVEHNDGSVQVAILSATHHTLSITSPEFLSGSVALNYGWLGVIHILLGFDHLLFVLALMLIISQKMALIKTITAFTVAHSFTLALAVFGLISVPVILVETLIALSIVFLAKEALQQTVGIRGWSSKKPWLVALGFGLLHGLGFANVLQDLGLPKGEELLALATFNLGVEVGQVAFVFIAWPILHFALPHQALNASLYKHQLTAGKTYLKNPTMNLHTILVFCIGSIAGFWTVERVLSLYYPYF